MRALPSKGTVEMLTGSPVGQRLSDRRRRRSHKARPASAVNPHKSGISRNGEVERGKVGKL